MVLVHLTLGPVTKDLLTELTKYVNFCLAGWILALITPRVFFDASLRALRERDGGINPIAVGNTLRHLQTRPRYSLGLIGFQERFQPSGKG